MAFPQKISARPTNDLPVCNISNLADSAAVEKTALVASETETESESDNPIPTTTLPSTLSTSRPIIHNKSKDPLGAIQEAARILSCPSDALSMPFLGQESATLRPLKTNNNLISISLANRPRWIPREDVFLVGCVLDTYYRRHSLKPTRNERDDAIKNKVSPNTLVWQIIHRKFTNACKRYFELTERDSYPRTLRALQKRWKSKSKILNAEENAATLVPPTKIHEREWDNIYNRDFLLSCPEARYQLKKEKYKALYQQIVFARDIVNYV